MKNPFVLRPYNLSQLAHLYQVSRPTMKKWIQPILSQLGTISCRLFTIRQVQIIFNHLGVDLYN